MDDDLHIPWDRASLEALLRKVITTVETTKVDFKATFSLNGSPEQGEFLKDVSAIANTYSHDYKNYGFIIFGAVRNKLIYTTFPNDEDHLQATIDDLLKKYIGPFITTHLFIFDDAGKAWGVLVVPPTRNAPHVFINDIHKRYRGDIYVRSGTTTEKAMPGDYARFFRQHLEEHTYEFQQSISDLQRQVSDLERQMKKARVPKRQSKRGAVQLLVEEGSVVEAQKEHQSVAERIDSLLAKEEDKITSGLLDEVRKINTFLDSAEISWAITSSEGAGEIISKVESVAGEFWSAVSSLVLKDEKGTYEESLVKAVTYLARKIEAPSGTSFTEWGNSVRYYPLFVTLYLIAITGTAKKRDRLLKKIFKLDLQGRSHYDEPLPMTYILFLIRRGSDFFQGLHPSRQKWCDPVASYTKLLVDRILNPDDPLWDKDREFYRGEFVLCASPMDVLEKTTNKPMIGHPSSGLYLFIGAAVPVITRFLKDDHSWLRKVFERSLEEILSEFDARAKDLGRGTGCFSEGFYQGALEAAFPEKAKQIGDSA